MKNSPILAWTAASAAAWLTLGSDASAQLTSDNSGNPTGPGIASSTENVDFGDVDQDGDWDAIFADGGDNGNDQNRIWINKGGLQAGTIGTFSDETGARLPAESDDSRDIEFADIDNDGDLDIYVSNTAQLSNQGNKWWVNNGGEQGGTLGFYTDETSSRWIDLGVNGSSIATALLSGGTFIDWSCDCDFGDLDNDGDLDLVHSSYGGAFGGQVPTRIFLNDGGGHFKEFNPSGFQLTGNLISNGNPAIWAQGTQQANTINFLGQFADVASTALDIDVGDIDGDFDLDILHGARQEEPRLFENRLEENGGVLGFRDITGRAFPNNWATGGGNYEQEMGDLDGDGDLDIYGLNWNGFSDKTFRNNGSGLFANLETNLQGSNADDNEGDFLDFDNDGDLDLFVANFSGNDKLYSNDGNGFMTLVQSTPGGASSLDADAADIDKDGDYDLIVAEDSFSANRTLINGTQVPDTHAPYIPHVENLGDRTAAPGTFPVRAQVYDNAPYYITWYNPTSIEFDVDGVTLTSRPMMSSQGQIFRGLLPSNLVGNVAYRIHSSDEYGNLGTSADQTYVATFGPAFKASFGAGVAGASGVPTLDAASTATSDSSLFLTLDGLSPSSGWLLFVTDAALASPLPLPGLATLNVGGNVLADFDGTANAAGQAAVEIPIGSGLPTGVSVYAQGFGLDGIGGNLLSSTQGLEVITQ
ncbi:FG-GAP repeat domain-containing protein [Engelhardtia mirabilis]|uniref:FG-GAP repeat protein n=1 Tax=Engelhardtia mirabilis TaxID=2528011 RepID=A0A518BN36_9BACT|nr:FG-GAP repeat protein [Planctomycetes bacterium Pla133]QDV02713.1 FG-GAP repeat protein [Planctomycetes bacterium Pla86]